MQARLAAHDLACRRGDRLLFRRLALECAPGDGVLVGGANGIGKSSLIRVLAGLLRPYAGRVERTGAAALLDDRLALDDRLPLGRALGFWAALDGQAAMLDQLALGALAEVPVRFLSTGQKKRAMMARLAAQRAPIWLLDEPLSGLDAESRDLIDALVAGHLAQGGIVVAASHQPFATPLRTLTLAEFAA